MTNHTKIQEDRRSNSLQRKVLKYLAMYGPKTLTRLYAGFDELPTAKIAIDRREARAGADGHISARVQARIQHAENHQSRQIYREKNNNRTR